MKSKMNNKNIVCSMKSQMKSHCGGWTEGKPAQNYHFFWAWASRDLDADLKGQKNCNNLKWCSSSMEAIFFKSENGICKFQKIGTKNLDVDNYGIY
jgi:hypothetical protein